MPELPEVETIAQALNRALRGAEVARAEVLRRALRVGCVLPDSFESRLENRRILGVRRQAKSVRIDLAGGDTLAVALGMTGKLLIGPARPAEKHDHVRLHLADGRILAFNDARRFGSLALAPTESDSESQAADPLTLTGAGLAGVMKGRRGAVKVALLDQRLIAGLGNIYACEALFGAGVAPLRPAGALTAEEYAALAAEIGAVLRASIAAGGTTFRDFRHADGSKGSFVEQLRVYGRASEPCPRCGAPVVRTVVSGRSTFACAGCQK
ncbi:formamidopyrimidine-DNA glycosylase [Alphaproteobacteria bacterium]|nr:formamidopyrimidine-DNA glycosylase [Alphaproteobacteria bacterium]